MDGSVYVLYGNGAGTNWATLRVSGGNGVDDSGLTLNGGEIVTDNITTDYWRFIIRDIILFDTSSIGVVNTITSADFSLYFRNWSHNLTGDYYLSVYTSAPASNTSLANGDFNSLGTTKQSNSNFATYTSAGYYTIALNGTGIGNVSKTGISKFGTRDVTYDAGGATPI